MVKYTNSLKFLCIHLCKNRLLTRGKHHYVSSFTITIVNKVLKRRYIDLINNAFGMFFVEQGTGITYLLCMYKLYWVIRTNTL